MNPPRKSIYVVLARNPATNHVIPIGPFETSGEALTWAEKARAANPTWLYSPDLLERPLWPEQ